MRYVEQSRISDAVTDARLVAVITCPECGSTTAATMPTDSCQFFWDCPHCNTLLRPNEGDCCVFCSYADVPCPPVQKNDTSCC